MCSIIIKLVISIYFVIQFNKMYFRDENYESSQYRLRETYETSFSEELSFGDYEATKMQMVTLIKFEKLKNGEDPF